MKNLILPTFIFFFIFSTLAFAQTTPDNSDFQIWNDTSVSISLKKSTDKNGKEFERTAFSINGTLRFRQNASRPVDERIGIGLNYRLNKYVSFAPDALYRGTQPGERQKCL